MTLLAALVRLVLAVRELVPNRARDDWFAFLPEGEPAHSELWDMVCGLPPLLIRLLILLLVPPSSVRVGIPMYPGVSRRPTPS
jgi:hypothetical protein